MNLVGQLNCLSVYPEENERNSFYEKKNNFSIKDFTPMIHIISISIYKRIFVRLFKFPNALLIYKAEKCTFLAILTRCLFLLPTPIKDFKFEHKLIHA